MDSIQAIAQEINEGMTSGQVIGRGKKNYTLWNFTVQGYRIYYKFVKMLSSSLEVVTASYPGVHIFEGLESDWHTQARLTGSINDMRHQLHNEESEQKGVMPFGKYKGMKINEIEDRSYICWLASQTMDKEEDPNAIEPWLWFMARERARQLKLITVGNQVLDPTAPTEYVRDTLSVKIAVDDGRPIIYNASSNDGRLWCAYNINIPSVEVGHPYYGTCRCCLVDGKPKKVKGRLITIYDYEVDGANINVKGFSVN